MRYTFAELSSEAKKFAVKMLENYLWACGKCCDALAIYECALGVWFTRWGGYAGDKQKSFSAQKEQKSTTSSIYYSTTSQRMEVIV